MKIGKCTMLIEPKSKLVMIGDSITDCGRQYPIGEASNDGLGNGYVSLVDALLKATYPGLQIRVINTGIGGNTVLDLEKRWESDVTALKPDWLSVMIGINDVWRQFDSQQEPKEVISRERYETTLEKLLRRTRPKLKGMILLAPYFIEPDRTDPMRAMMDTYGEVVQQLAVKQHAIFVDSQASMDIAMKDIPPTALALDRVHLNLAGHMILARAFLSTIGYEW
jgi:lysophospholipase L1-like esterase